MLLTGILLGLFVFNVLDEKILLISPELRKIALIIILVRAGLNLDFKELKEVGRPAFLLCFVPAVFEIGGMLLLGPRIFGLTLLESLVMGTVVAAVSPAVIVPRMLSLMEKGYGTKQRIPQMVMAGASVDDVFVIVLFTAFTGLMSTGELSYGAFLTIPSSILLGLLGGALSGLLLTFLFKRFHIRDTGKAMMILSVSFLLMTLEEHGAGVIGFSGLLAVMALGALVRERKGEVSVRLSQKFSKLWVGEEVLLFVLVGATVDLSYLRAEGFLAGLLLIGVLLFRMVGVLLSLLGTHLSKEERLFTAFAYMPKATVQAAIGGMPLAMGLPKGELILTVAVASIILTAPVGAVLMDRTHKKLLKKEVR